MAAPKKPADHLSAKSEAKGQGVEVEFNGVTYAVAPDALDNVEILECIEDEKYFRAIRLTIGAAQWERFKDSNRDDAGRVSADVFQEFVEVVFGALGN